MSRPRKPNLFVAMPFHKKTVKEGITVDFDRIYNELIVPAAEAADCAPFRADEESAAGDIRTDMFFELVTADFVLADVSSRNPNVLYELGIRHGVTPNGVILMDGQWGSRPFDIAMDRSLNYDGQLFEARPSSAYNSSDSAKTEQERRRLIKQERIRLTRLLADAIASDLRTVSSPLYKELPGLVPVDWSEIKSARARYYGSEFDSWRARVRAARQQGRVGDVLTLAHDAPNRLYEWRQRLDAARALIELGVSQRAVELLREMESEDASCVETPYLKAKALIDLKRVRDADLTFTKLLDEKAEHLGDRSEGFRIRGRVVKQQWQNQWQHIEDLAQRRREARKSWPSVASRALDYYKEAQMRDLSSFHAGINVVSLHRLGVFLGVAHLNANDTEVDDLVGLIRTSARARMQADRRELRANTDHRAAIYAEAVLAELALLSGDLEGAVDGIHRVVTDPETSRTQLVSLDDQMALYQSLGFEKSAVSRIRAEIDGLLARRHPLSAASEYKRVIPFCGQSFDSVEFIGDVEEAIREKTEQLEIDESCLILCNARRGTELTFAKLALGKGAAVRFLLPEARAQFLQRAVKTERENTWEAVFQSLLGHDKCEVLEQSAFLGAPPIGLDPYDRNNAWCLESARSEADATITPVTVRLFATAERELDLRGSVDHFIQTAERFDMEIERLRIKIPTLEPTRLTGMGVLVAEAGHASYLHEVSENITVGRAKDNDIILRSGRVSRYHLRLEPTFQGIRPINLSAHEGATMIGDTAMPMPSDPGEHSPVFLQVGDVLYLSGDVEISVVTHPPSEQEAPARTSAATVH
ncbi:MAG: FHA domain-containing protein [Pseudomonadota bacterium]